MNIEKYTTSIDISRELKEMGCPQNSIFVWEYFNENRYNIMYSPLSFKEHEHNNVKLFSAYTVGELGELLGFSPLVTRIRENQWELDLGTPFYLNRVYSGTEADARATLLIINIKEKNINVKDLKL